MKRLFVITLLTLLAGGAALWGFRIWQARSAPHIAVTGGKPMSVRLPVKGAHFMQDDPTWAREKIGGSAESIRSVGCTLCSVATAAQFMGESVDPKTFNRELIANGGYTDQGWLVWPAVAKVFQKRVEAVMTTAPSHETLDSALEQGQYPIIKFILPAGIPHWVVIVGKEGLDYLIYDPLVAIAEPVPLSHRASAIYSVRIVKRGV